MTTHRKCSSVVFELSSEIRRNQRRIERLKWKLDQTRLIKSIAIRQVILAAYERQKAAPADVTGTLHGTFMDGLEYSTIARQKFLLTCQMMKKKNEERTKLQVLLHDYQNKMQDADLELIALKDEFSELMIAYEKNEQIITISKNLGCNNIEPSTCQSSVKEKKEQRAVCPGQC